MAKDLSDTVRDMLGDIASEAVKNIGDAKSDKETMAGARGLAAGAAVAALAPLAKKGFDAIRSNGVPSMPSIPSVNPGKAAGKAASKVGDKVGDKVKEGVSDKVDQAGGAGGIAKKAVGGLMPGGGDDGGGGKEGMEGVGKGRRMPVQQAVDVAVPLETAYNQWTQFEEWPNFMHRVTRVTQEDDDCSVSFATKIWGRTREFVADIETQRPDERIKWRVSQGITHTGVVTFHELAPRLTRIELNVDVDPGSLIEKFARGARHIKRAMRADLHRYKAFIEMQEVETGAWRGVIEEGELVEEHDESYDDKREYSDAQQLEYGSENGGGADEDEEEEEQEEQEEQEERPRARSTQRAKSQTRRSSSSSGGPSKSGSAKTKSKASGSSRSSSRSRGSSNGKSRASSSGASSKRSSKSSGSSSRSRSGGSSKRKSSSGGSS